MKKEKGRSRASLKQSAVSGPEKKEPQSCWKRSKYEVSGQAESSDVKYRSRAWEQKECCKEKVVNLREDQVKEHIFLDLVT